MHNGYISESLTAGYRQHGICGVPFKFSAGNNDDASRAGTHTGD